MLQTIMWRMVTTKSIHSGIKCTVRGLARVKMAVIGIPVTATTDAEASKHVNDPGCWLGTNQLPRLGIRC